MSSARLQARVPSAKPIGIYQLENFKLDFSMHGFDDSAKCNILPCTENGSVYGVLFLIDAAERIHLDKAEQLGEGYELIESSVYLHKTHSDKPQHIEVNQHQPCFFYTALRTHNHLKPYHWYKHHVVFGAEEAGLPACSIQALQAFDSIDDHDRERHQEQMAIYQTA